MLTIPKKVFYQGDIIPIVVNTSKIKESLVKGILNFIGTEKVEFSMMSLLGKTGFEPSFSFILPSKHIRESTELISQTHILEPKINGYYDEMVNIEIPENAIPSYYGNNGKVVYEIKLELELENGSQKTESQQILLDAVYQPTSEVKEIHIDNGKMIIKYEKPFIIGIENQFEISTENLKISSPLRFVIKGIETVKASSGMVVQNEVCSLPLGQIKFDEDLRNVVFNFHIPSDNQHSFEGINSRLEYFFELHYVQPKKRIGVDRSKLKLLSQFPITLEYSIDQNNVNKV